MRRAISTRANLLRELSGPDCQPDGDANQQWTVKQAEYVCEAVRDLNLFWSRSLSSG